MNNLIAGLRLAAVYACFAGTAVASTIKFDQDRSVDMSNWKYVAWVAEVGQLSIKEQRIDDAVEKGFAGRGYVFVEGPQRADFLVNWRAAAWQDVRLESGPRSPAFGRDFRMAREAMGALVITVYDRRTGRVAWHGTVSDALADNPEQADKKTAKAVEKLLKKFPTREEAK